MKHHTDSSTSSGNKSPWCNKKKNNIVEEHREMSRIETPNVLRIMHRQRQSQTTNKHVLRSNLSILFRKQFDPMWPRPSKALAHNCTTPKGIGNHCNMGENAGKKRFIIDDVFKALHGLKTTQNLSKNGPKTVPSPRDAASQNARAGGRTGGRMGPRTWAKVITEESSS